MGKIFNPDALISGSYPEIGAHKLAAQAVFDGFQTLNENSEVADSSGYIQGLMYGSVTR